MVKFNPFDYHMEGIMRESRLVNLKTRHAIKVVGLRNPGNPAIRLRLAPGIRLPKPLTSFLTVNSLGYAVIRSRRQRDSQKRVIPSPESQIKIGLRRDLRENITLASALLQTLVYALEGRLKIPSGYVIPGLPVFPDEVPDKNKIKPPEIPPRCAGQYYCLSNPPSQWTSTRPHPGNPLGWVRIDERMEPIF